MTGGSSYEVHLEHAAAAIAAGLCDVVVERLRRRRPAATGRGSARCRGGVRPGPNPMAEWEWPYGLRMPMGPYALAATRHMHEFGTTSEQLAQIAVSTRDWATLNPRARYQTPITIDDVLASPLQNRPAAPARLLPGHRRGRRLRHDQRRAGPVAAQAAGLRPGCRHLPRPSDDHPDARPDHHARGGLGAPRLRGGRHHARPTSTCSWATTASPSRPCSISRTSGFCAKGEGGPFAEDGKLGPGGSLPMNTNGGGLSYTHPGMYGMFLIVEAVRQLRGEAEARQVEGAEIAVAHGSGMVLSCMSTAVLGTEATL